MSASLQVGNSGDESDVALLKLISRYVADWCASHVLVFVNGRVCHEASCVSNLPRGVVCDSWDKALADPACAERIMRLKPEGAGSFTGAVLYAPSMVVIAEPVHLLFVHTGKHIKENALNINNLTLADEKSEFTVIEEHIGLDALANNTVLQDQSGGVESRPCLQSNVVTRVDASVGAKVSYCKLQYEDAAASHAAKLQINLAAASAVRTVHCGSGAFEATETINVILSAPEASCELYGLYVLGDSASKSHAVYRTQVEHQAPHCTSAELFKGVVGANAHAEFIGKVVVHPQALHSRTKLQNRNLLLADTARVTTTPALEIYADEVLCSHGATCGQLEVQALRYLQSRGILEVDARRMLLDGFMREVIAQLPEFLQKRGFFSR